MANEVQRKRFDQQIARMKEDGFFLPAKRSMAGEDRYLIISYGGTGADALFGVKEKMEEELNAKEIAERVRFLAIDTDRTTQKTTVRVTTDDGREEAVEVDRLESRQFCQLRGNAARNLFSTELDSNVSTWFSTDLEQKVLADSTFLDDGKGASGIRQLGRLTLYPADTYTDITSRVLALVKELTNNRSCKLRVFILTGIAGGTGSGTVIDLTYLIRNTIKNHFGANWSRADNFVGFVLLPSTGTSDNQDQIDHGNRNGYAALKEINQFMTLSERREQYSFTYGNGVTVTSEDKIFNVCYLIDGRTGDVIFGSPREQAVRVISESILDMLTSSQSAAAGHQVQAVDSFMNDAQTFKAQMIGRHSVRKAVRDADFLYCALGHSEFAIPTNEIKAYVGHKLFEKIYRLFQLCGNVTHQDVMEFLTNVIRRDGPVKKAMDTELDNVFKNVSLKTRKGGPFYTINLLKDVENGTAVLRHKLRLLRPGNVSDEELTKIEDYALKKNNEIFEAYKLVMEGLKNLMAEQYGTVVATTPDGDTYSFMPLFMGEAGDERAKSVISYLDSLINENSVTELVDELLEEMIKNRDNWIALIQSKNTSVADAAATIRRFWNTKLDDIVKATLEDFLIKYYSGIPTAYYNPDNPKDTEVYLKTAANAIYNSMLGVGGTAQAMVQMTNGGLTEDDFNGHTYLMVPKAAKNLLRELQAVALLHSTRDNPVDVFESHSNDRISCYKQYSSVPTYKLTWTQEAEAAYERDMASEQGVGTHMSETIGGKQWKNFPNLLPKSCWHLLPGNYRNEREAGLDQEAHDLLKKAMSLHLTSDERANTGMQIYSVYHLPTEYRPSDNLFVELRKYREDSPEYRQAVRNLDAAAEDCAAKLFAKKTDWTESDVENIRDTLKNNGVSLRRHLLKYPNTVMAKGPADDDLENWDQYIAGCVLRKLPDTVHELKATVIVMEKLVAKIKAKLMTAVLIRRFAQYLAVGMFTKNEERERWEYKDEQGLTKVLVYLDNPIAVAADYYLMFNAFRSDYLSIALALRDKFSEKNPDNAEEDERIERRNAFKTGGRTLKETVYEWLDEDPVRDLEEDMNVRGMNPEAARNFYRALYHQAGQIERYGYEHVTVEPETPQRVNIAPPTGDF